MAGLLAGGGGGDGRRARIGSGTSKKSYGPTLGSGGSGRGGGGQSSIASWGGGGGSTNTGGGSYQAPPPGDASASSWMEQQAANQATAGQQNQYFNPYGPQGPAGTTTWAGQTREMTPEEYADAKMALARQAQESGMSKAEWMNQMYGTDFFKNTAGQGAQQTWGDDWYL